MPVELNKIQKIKLDENNTAYPLIDDSVILRKHSQEESSGFAAITIEELDSYHKHLLRALKDPTGIEPLLKSGNMIENFKDFLKARDDDTG